MRFWTELAVVALAVVGLWVTVDKTAAGVVRAWGWLVRDRVTPLLEEANPLEPLPPEHAWGRLKRPARVGVIMPGPLVPSSLALEALLTALRERSGWMIEHRAAYESMGFDYPSGLMARVRELAP